MTDEETGGRKEGWRKEVKSQKERRSVVVKRQEGVMYMGEEGERKRERERWTGEGREEKRNHAWFTFNLSKGHGLPRGARARVRPLWAEQWVLIVLLVGVVGVVLRHGN